MKIKSAVLVSGVVLLLFCFALLITPVSAADGPPSWWPADIPYATSEPTENQSEGMAYRESGNEGMAYREVSTQPAQGYIRVSSTPSAATAIVDDYLQGTTTYIFTVSGERYHTVRVQLYGYQPYSQSVLVKSGQTAEVRATLTPNAPVTGGVSVSSTPPGADIYIDGSYRGETAATIGGLSPGTHSLSLRKAGYYDATSTFSVSPGSVTIRSVTLQKYPPKSVVGSIEVISDPPGAQIYLDGNFQGVTHTGTPFDIIGISPGTHIIRLELADYQPFSRSVTVTEGGITPVVAVLIKNTPPPVPDTTGQLYISSSPAGADVFLDNAYKGFSPLSLSDIPAGSHVVLLKLPGYTDWTGTTTVIAGQTTTLAGSLTPIPVTTPTKAGTGVVVTGMGILSIVVAVLVAQRRGA